ncbi:Ribonuclease P protein subunit P38-related [Euphorbia peplus]|nr:Ribonuclease P protein subunit P38-related [Euphorbia peplus]
MADQDENKSNDAFSSYLGLTFSLFLASLPTNSISLIHNLHSQINDLSFRLYHAEEQLKLMKLRRKEDSKANARVVEIFASHRNAWQAEEKRLLHQIDAATEELASFRARFQDFEAERGDWKAKVLDLEREVTEREEIIGFMSRNAAEENDEEEEREEEVSRGCGNSECYHGEEDDENVDSIVGGFNSEFLPPPGSKFWSEKANLWQDMHCESLESLYHVKHFVPRRESPRMVDGESTGISSKLKLLEQELLKLESFSKTDSSKVLSQTRKQTRRYQALSGKIDDLCRRMQASDPCEATMSPEFRIQRQTEFLLEAFRLQQRASETAQKQTTLHTEIGKSYYGDEMDNQLNVTVRRSFDTIRNNMKEVQRNLEIWLARIIGNLEGILARDGASRAREFYGSRHPFAQ